MVVRCAPGSLHGTFEQLLSSHCIWRLLAYAQASDGMYVLCALMARKGNFKGRTDCNEHYDEGGGNADDETPAYEFFERVGLADEYKQYFGACGG